MNTPAWMNGVSLGTVVVSLFVVLTVGGLLYAMLRPVMRGVRRTDGTVQELRRDWFGQEGRPGFPPVPGVPQRLFEVEQSLAVLRPIVERIDKEMHANGGSSLRDQISKVSAGLEDLRRSAETDRVQMAKDVTTIKSDLGSFTRALENSRTLRALAVQAEQGDDRKAG